MADDLEESDFFCFAEAFLSDMLIPLASEIELFTGYGQGVKIASLF
jgi:hypothetical protein